MLQENIKQAIEERSMEKICAKCGKTLGTEDKYCRYCGARREEREYSPNNDFYRVALVYGPPPRESEHVCLKCGYSWTTFSMDDKERYCPKCGGDAPIKEEEEKPRNADWFKKLWSEINGDKD